MIRADSLGAWRYVDTALPVPGFKYELANNDARNRLHRPAESADWWDVVCTDGGRITRLYTRGYYYSKSTPRSQVTSNSGAVAVRIAAFGISVMKTHRHHRQFGVFIMKNGCASTALFTA